MFLRSLGFDSKSLITAGLDGLEDLAVMALARKERRILVTFDLDFGELYYFSPGKNFGVIILRLDDQSVESVHAILAMFLRKHHGVLRRKRKGLIVLDEGRARITQ